MFIFSILFTVIGIVALVFCFVYIFKKQKQKGLIAVVVCVISIFIGNIFLKIYDNNQGSSSSVTKTSSVLRKTNESSQNVSNTSKVKKLVKPLSGKDGIDSIKVLGFDNTDIAGGSIVVVTDDSKNAIEKSTIDEIIASLCQKLGSDLSIVGTGVNIKITSPDYATDNDVVTGYAHVDKDNLTKINKDNIQQYVSDYQNKGNQFNN